MPFRIIIAIYPEIRMKRINKLLGRNVYVINVRTNWYMQLTLYFIILTHPLSIQIQASRRKNVMFHKGFVTPPNDRQCVQPVRTVRLISYLTTKHVSCKASGRRKTSFWVHEAIYMCYYFTVQCYRISVLTFKYMFIFPYRFRLKHFLQEICSHLFSRLALNTPDMSVIVRF
jgi:hypothetical protein